MILRFWAKSAGRRSGFGVVSVTYDFWPKAQAMRVRLRKTFGLLRFWAKSTGRGSGFGIVSVTYDLWPQVQAVGQAFEYFRSLMIFGQNHRPRVRLRSSFGHLRFLAKSTGRRSGFGIVSVTYEFWPQAQAAGQASK